MSKMEVDDDKPVGDAEMNEEDGNVKEEEKEGEGKEKEKEKEKESPHVVSVSSIEKKATAAYEAALAASGSGDAQSHLVEGIDALLGVEKAARLGGDAAGVKAACLAIMDLSKLSGWTMVNENIMTLSKRRAQLRQAVAAIVIKAMSWIDEIDDTVKGDSIAKEGTGAKEDNKAKKDGTVIDEEQPQSEKEKMIRTLLAVTAGKIFVEVERARLTRMLADMKEKDGNIKEAAEVMQDVAVETFGAMSKTEKIHFILEQVRLCLDKNDYVRAQILSKKIAPRALTSEEVVKDAETATPASIGDGYHMVPPAEGTPSLPELRVRYYELMIRYYVHKREHLEVCRCYRAIYENKGVLADEEKWRPVLQRICWFVVLSKHGPAQQSLLFITSSDKRLDEIPLYKKILQFFTTKEVIDWSTFMKECGDEMDSNPEIFGVDDEGDKRREDLRERVVEHNILVVAKYYTRITLARLSELLDQSVDKAESALSSMVVDKAVSAKIDRPKGLVLFSSGSGTVDSMANDMLNGWADNIAKLLGIVETSTHRLHKEIQVASALAKPVTANGN